MAAPTNACRLGAIPDPRDDRDRPLFTAQQAQALTTGNSAAAASTGAVPKATADASTVLLKNLPPIYNQWYIAAFRRDVTEKTRRQIIAGLPLVLYRLPDGAAVALEDRCPHRDVPLSMGSLQADGTLQCLYHGIRFDREGTAPNEGSTDP